MDDLSDPSVFFTMIGDLEFYANLGVSNIFAAHFLQHDPFSCFISVEFLKKRKKSEWQISLSSMKRFSKKQDLKHAKDRNLL